jgi:hypothetical protein
MKALSVFMLLSTLLAAAPSHAARAIDVPPPTRAAVLNTPLPDPATQADDSSSLRQGVVSDVSPNADRLLVNGSWLRVAEGSTRLFRQGRPVQANAVGKGQLIQFTLAPGVADRKTLGIVYVP